MEFSLTKLLFKNVELSQFYVDKEKYTWTSMHELADFTTPEDQESLYKENNYWAEHWMLSEWVSEWVNK